MLLSLQSPLAPGQSCVFVRLRQDVTLSPVREILRGRLRAQSLWCRRSQYTSSQPSCSRSQLHHDRGLVPCWCGGDCPVVAQSLRARSAQRRRPLPMCRLLEQKTHHVPSDRHPGPVTRGEFAKRGVRTIFNSTCLEKNWHSPQLSPACVSRVAPHSSSPTRAAAACP